MTLVNLCHEAIRLDRWRTARRDAKEKNKLCKLEAEILHAAAECGTGEGLIQLVPINHVPSIMAGGRIFDGATPYDRAKYIDAFFSLCSRGLIRPSGTVDSEGNPSAMFLLTGEAFDLDRELHS